MDSSPEDLTPSTGAPTDVAPLGHSTPPPPHERTADEEAGQIPWERIAALPAFQELIRAKLRFIIPATIFFVTYYLLLPVLVGYCPELMKQEVWGRANLAYVFGLSQFFMAWALAGLYVVVAAGWDRRAAAVLAQAPLP